MGGMPQRGGQLTKEGKAMDKRPDIQALKDILRRYDGDYLHQRIAAARKREGSGELLDAAFASIS